MTTDTLTEPSQQAARPARGLVPLFLGLILSMLLAALNQTVLATALPTMVGELDGVAELPWVITAYLLAMTVVLPIYGKVGDLIGRKHLLLAAIGLFMAGSLIGALAGGMGMLIAGRVVQGLGAGGLIILSQAIIADVVPARDRGRYMGVMGGVFAFASVAGPLLGGWFTEGPGWRWTFWINLPLGVAALAVVMAFLHLPNGTYHGRGRRPRLDYLGMGLLSLATTCLVLVATWGGTSYAWTSSLVLGLIAGTVLTGGLFVLVEHRAAEPIVPLRLFRNRDFNLTTAAGMLTGITMFGAIGYLPTYLQMTTGADATAAGMLMIPMMGALLLTSMVMGWYVSRTGRYRWVPIAGSLVLAGGLLLMSTMAISTPIWLICLYTSVFGAGIGTSLQLLVLVVQNSFPISQVGTATAANNFFRQVGGSLGAAVVGSVFASRLLVLLAERLPGQDALPGGTDSLTPEVVRSLPAAVRPSVLESYNDALTPVFLLMVPLGVVAAALLCFLTGKPLATRIERDPPDPPE